MDYFRLLNNLDEPVDRWFLGEVNFDGEWDFWKYIGTSPVTDVIEKEFSITIRSKGRPVDFNFGDFQIIVLNERVVYLMQKQQLQLFPIKIDGHLSDVQYYLTVLTKEIDCVDEGRSEFDRWEAGNDIRPDKAGHYKTFYKLFVDAEKCEDSDIFRIKNYNVAVIVSERLKNLFEKDNISGVKFQKVV